MSTTSASYARPCQLPECLRTREESCHRLRQPYQERCVCPRNRSCPCGKRHQGLYLSPSGTYSGAELGGAVLRLRRGVCVTASHNPAKYNGYKVYGADGCQITTESAADILAEIEKLDIFADVKTSDFEAGVINGSIQYIPDEVYTAFVDQVKNQSVLFGEKVNKDVAIVYSPLNGTGLKPVTRT